MGRKRNRKNKDAANQPDASCKPDASYNKFPFNLPQIIPIETFRAIAEYMLQLPGSQRNVFLTAKEYSMEHINPMHIRTKDSPTHMVVFCLRLIMSDHFNPIGVVQINKRVEYVKKLAVVWKAFIQDLSILRIFVIGSMSPCTLTFQDVLIELTQNPNLEDNTGPITYSVWPYREILHLYDYYSLVEEFVEAFYDRNEVFFLTRQPSSVSEKMSSSKSKNLQLYCASWNDIQLTSAVSFDFEDNEMGPDELIFNRRFRNAYRAVSKKGIFSTESRASTDRLLDLLWQYVDISYTNINLNPYALQELYDKHEDFRIALATAQFRWYVIEVSSLDTSSAEPKVSSAEMHETNHTRFELKGNSQVRDILPTDQNSIGSGSSIELNDNEINDLINVINNTPEHYAEELSNEDSYFDKFLRKIVYDDYDLYLKTCPTVGSTEAQSAEEENHIASRAERALIHDHDYFSGAKAEVASTEIESESETFKMLREYFGDLKQKRKKLVQDSQNSLDGCDCQNNNAAVGNGEYIFKANEDIDKEYQLNAKCDNNNHIDQELAKVADFMGQQLLAASNMYNVYGKIDSRRIKKFQYEMQQLTVSTNEIGLDTTESSVDQRDSSLNTSPDRTPCRGIRLIPYRKPSMNSQNCSNSNNEQCNVSYLQGNESSTRDCGENVITNTDSLSARVQNISNNNRQEKGTPPDILKNTNCKWEYFQTSITIDSLDLANCNAHILGGHTECIKDLAITHCSDGNLLDIEKPVVDNDLTKSVDSLVELVNTFDADNQITKLPSKHIILKGKTKKVHETNIPDTISNLEKRNRPVNSLKSSKSDSVLYLKTNSNETVSSLASRSVWKQPRNICSISMNCRPKKSPVQELKELMKTIPALNLCNQRVDVVRDAQTYSTDYNNIFLKTSFSTKSENCQEINKTSTNEVVFLNQERAEMKTNPLKNNSVDHCTRNTRKQDDTNHIEIECDSPKIRSPKINISETQERKIPRPNSNVFGSSNNTVPGFDSEGHIRAFLTPATPQISSTEKTFHLKDTMEVDEVDYRNYRKNLLSILGDYKKPYCDTFRDKDTFNKLYSAIPPEAESVRVTNDWLCTFKGYLKLKEILERRKVRFVRSKLLCLDHIDFFVALIKKLKNNVLSTVYEGPGYKFVDYKCAFDMLYSGDGVYILTQD